MNRHLLRYVMKRQNAIEHREHGEDFYDSRNDGRNDGRNDYDMRMSDSRDVYDYEDGAHEPDYEDGRKSHVSRDYMRRDRRDDYGDYSYSRMRLKKSDMHKWKNRMENADGTRGEHFDMQQVIYAAEKIGVNFRDFSEKEFCITMNMMYSDYCKTIKKFVSPEKEILFCAELARDFLDDSDGPEPSEKLALYYYCIVSSEDI